MNNDTTIEAVLKHFFPGWSVKKRTSRRLRCLRHIINLAAKAFLYSKEADAFEKDIESFKEKSDLLKELTLWRKRGPIGKLYNIVIFIYRTPQRRERFASIRTFDSDEKGDFDHL